MVATPSPHSDFPVTRGLIATLPTWVNQLASLLPRPVPVPAQPRGFRWAYSDETAEVVQIAKAVRMVSGIAAAMHLADLGFTVECGTVLRTVSDFASEITFLAEGHLTGRMNPDQERFVKDFFKPMPTTPESLHSAAPHAPHSHSPQTWACRHIQFHSQCARSDAGGESPRETR